MRLANHSPSSCRWIHSASADSAYCWRRASVAAASPFAQRITTQSNGDSSSNRFVSSRHLASSTRFFASRLVFTPQACPTPPVASTPRVSCSPGRCRLAREGGGHAAARIDLARGHREQNATASKEPSRPVEELSDINTHHVLEPRVSGPLQSSESRHRRCPRPSPACEHELAPAAGRSDQPQRPDGMGTTVPLVRERLRQAAAVATSRRDLPNATRRAELHQSSDPGWGVVWGRTPGCGFCWVC